jgi:transposase
MSARIQVSYTPWDERQGHTGGTGTSPPPGRPTRPGGILGRGGRRLPWRRSPLGAAVGRRIPAGGRRRPTRPARRRATAQADQTQAKIIRRWLADQPTEHGFATDLWTGPRLAHLIRQEFGIALNPKYLTGGLRRRGFTPPRPQRVPRQRDLEVIAAWLESDWPRLKQSPTAGGAPRPERRERPAEGSAGPSHLGAAGRAAGPGPGRRPSPQGLVGRAVRGRLGRRSDAHGGPDPPAGVPLR